VGLRLWGTALPALWSVEMRLSCGAACGRLMERELGLSAVGRSCRYWRSAAGRFVREELEKEGSARCCRMKKAPLRLEKGAAEREDLWKGELIRGCC